MSSGTKFKLHVLLSLSLSVCHSSTFKKVFITNNFLANFKGSLSFWELFDLLDTKELMTSSAHQKHLLQEFFFSSKVIVKNRKTPQEKCIKYSLDFLKVIFKNENQKINIAMFG